VDIVYRIREHSTDENHKVVDIARKRITKSWTLSTRSWTLAM